jgi:hypothetical protein
MLRRYAQTRKVRAKGFSSLSPSRASWTQRFVTKQLLDCLQIESVLKQHSGECGGNYTIEIYGDCWLPVTHNCICSKLSINVNRKGEE